MTVPKNVNVWADGFGVWHASVPLTNDPAADARHARRLIVSELKQREGSNFNPRRVRVEREAVTSHGTAKFREKTDG